MRNIPTLSLTDDVLLVLAGSAAARTVFPFLASVRLPPPGAGVSSCRTCNQTAHVRQDLTQALDRVRKMLVSQPPLVLDQLKRLLKADRVEVVWYEGGKRQLHVF
jgi:hypothetical protein